MTNSNLWKNEFDEIISQETAGLTWFLDRELNGRSMARTVLDIFST